MIFKVISQARTFVYLFRHSLLLLCFLFLAVASSIYNGIQLEDAIKLAMYFLTILFASWLAINLSVDDLVEALYRIGAVVLVAHVLLFPLVGSAIDYDALHRSTVLGTEPYAGVFGHKNIAGSFFAMMSLISFIRLLSSKRSRPWSALFLMLHLVALAAAGAAGAIVGLAGATVVTIGIYLAAASNRQIASVYWLAIAGLVLLMLSIPQEDMYELVGRTAGLTGRSFLWSVWPYFFWQKPWLGYGFGGFFSSLSDAPVTELTRMAPWNTVYASFENSYLDVLLQFGILGGGVYIVMMLVAIASAIRFAFGSAEGFRLVPIGLLTLTVILGINDSSLMLHNYITCAITFWCYFGPEAQLSGAEARHAPLAVRGA
ncbi:O-antigen ligase family protein [Bradyrhizobium guangzhouense]|uniref:O-antigen ligase family protein n=1 Tax=Bradyrhizobium guangzhouense TaxID=1325095 RepID=UPI001FE15B1F|nr:O-antigen ligase family protein [Bradyrhizobium guangzhouense]